eukprot:m.368349 g.368349  ORF g.368349 m.368349 type:complete len:177 (+) comp16666_c1_seq41:4393-4923(+)
MARPYTRSHPPGVATPTDPAVALQGCRRLGLFLVVEAGADWSPWIHQMSGAFSWTQSEHVLVVSQHRNRNPTAVTGPDWAFGATKANEASLRSLGCTVLHESSLKFARGTPVSEVESQQMVTVELLRPDPSTRTVVSVLWPREVQKTTGAALSTLAALAARAAPAATSRCQFLIVN